MLGIRIVRRTNIGNQHCAYVGLTAVNWTKVAQMSVLDKKLKPPYIHTDKQNGMKEEKLTARLERSMSIALIRSIFVDCIRGAIKIFPQM